MKFTCNLFWAAATLMLGGSIIWIASAQQGHTPERTLQELQQQAAALSQQARALRDEKEIENLQRIYGYYLDKKLWSEIVELFAADATLELGQNGVYAGKASIRRAFGQFGADGLKEGELFNHMLLQSVIHVAADGSSAKGRWRGFNQAGEYGKRAVWGEGVYENEYVKEAGVWKIKRLHYYNSFTTPYEKGWAREVLPASRPIAKGFEPDSPPSVTYEGFPKYFVPPFHYPNPVTGKPPLIGASAEQADGSHGGRGEEE